MRLRLTLLLLLLAPLASAQTVFSRASVLDFYGRPAAPSNPPSNYGRVYFDTVSAQMKCITSTGASCFAAAGGSGTVTSIATTGPITGGTITTTGTIACATCVVATSPGAGVAHFAGSTQTVTSSAVTPSDATGNTSGSGNFCLVTSCAM